MSTDITTNYYNDNINIICINNNNLNNSHFNNNNTFAFTTDHEVATRSHGSVTTMTRAATKLPPLAGGIFILKNSASTLRGVDRAPRSKSRARMHPFYNDKEIRFVDMEKERLLEIRFCRITKKKDYQKCDPTQVGKKEPTFRGARARAPAADRIFL